MMDRLSSLLRPKDRKGAGSLTAEGKREVIFLFSLMGDQRDWLADNMKWILKNNGGDIIASWLLQYIYDPMGYAQPLDDSVWEGCLADYRGKRDEILDEWRNMKHENGEDCAGNRFRQGELDL
ncbi:MAG: hypothetical protein WC136_09520 [Sphaerochaeta sp.]|jgi:hypothetical protein|nr:hypothetical protein [Sphaerochaeta sp.]